MSGGSSGGGGYYPQDNSIQLEQMRQAEAARVQAAADAKTAQNRTDFTNNLSKATAAAKNTGRDYFSSIGLSPDSNASLIDSIINDAKLKVPDLDTNPGQYFTSDAFASGLDNAQKAKRANLNSKVNSTFTPGFEKSLISDSADDAIIDSILNSQRDTALQSLDYNKNRGILNDTGYAAALRELTGQENAGRSTLNSIGQGILSKDRDNALSFRTDAGTAASNFVYGSADPDIAGYYTSAKNKASSDLSDLDGAIRASLGSTNLFDVPTLLQKGGAAQGPINAVTPETAAAPFDPKKSAAKRGLGSTGVF